MTRAVRAASLAAALALAACGAARPVLDARMWVDRSLVEQSLGVGVLGGGASVSGESVYTFDLADGEAFAVAARYTDREPVSQIRGALVDEFTIDCVSVAMFATNPPLPQDAVALGQGIRERMKTHKPDC